MMTVCKNELTDDLREANKERANLVFINYATTSGILSLIVEKAWVSAKRVRGGRRKGRISRVRVLASAGGEDVKSD